MYYIHNLKSLCHVDHTGNIYGKRKHDPTKRSRATQSERLDATVHQLRYTQRCVRANQRRYPRENPKRCTAIICSTFREKGQGKVNFRLVLFDVCKKDRNF